MFVAPPVMKFPIVVCVPPTVTPVEVRAASVASISDPPVVVSESLVPVVAAFFTTVPNGLAVFTLSRDTLDPPEATAVDSV